MRARSSSPHHDDDKQHVHSATGSQAASPLPFTVYHSPSVFTFVVIIFRGEQAEAQECSLEFHSQ